MDHDKRTGNKTACPLVPYKLQITKKKSAGGGDTIGRILLIEFKEEDAAAFDEVMAVLKRHTDFKMFSMDKETVISLPGLTIYPEQRKIYRDRQEIPLTTKEYELLCLLASNRGQVLTYTQIYEKVWDSTSSGNERIIRFHLCNLRKKLNAISRENPFVIRCIRDVGYCFEVKSK